MTENMQAETKQAVKRSLCGVALNWKKLKIVVCQGANYTKKICFFVIAEC